MPNLFANVIDWDVVDNLTDAQADLVLAIFDKPRVTTISREDIETTQATVLDIILNNQEV